MINFGLYGLTFALPAGSDTSRFVSAPPPDWPLWTVTTSIETMTRSEHWDAEQAVLRMRPDGYAFVHRAARRSELVMPDGPAPVAWAHPLLSLTSAAAALWSGHHALHAGGFVVDGRAWLVCADSDAGKSSFLCWLAQHGIPIVTDDLAVVVGGRVMAGPRCLDLREGAADHFGVGEDIGVVGSRRRWRVDLGPVEPEYPLAGWISLSWGDEVSTTALPPVARMALIVASRALRVAHVDNSALLPLLSTPAVRFARPRDWGRINEAMTTMLAALPSRRD